MLLLPFYKLGKQGSKWSYMKIQIFLIPKSMSFNIAPGVIRSILPFTHTVYSTVIDMCWVPDRRHIPAPPRTHLLVERDETCARALQGSLITPHLSLTGEWAVTLSAFYRCSCRALTQRGLRDLVAKPHFIWRGRNAQGHRVTCSSGLVTTIVQPRWEPRPSDFQPRTLKICWQVS